MVKFNDIILEKKYLFNIFLFLIENFVRMLEFMVKFSILFLILNFGGVFFGEIL